MEKNPEAGIWVKRIANGNKDAEALMWVMWNFAHLFDDLVDCDKPVSAEQAGRAFIDLVAVLSFNPFWQRHAHHLCPLLVSSVNRWIDGDEWEASGDPNKAAAARFVRCGDVDFYLAVAYCVGGWEHMRAMRGARSYDN